MPSLRHSPRRRFSSWLAVALTLVLGTLAANTADVAAQTATRTPTPIPTPQLVRVEVSPKAVTRKVGEFASFSVKGFFSDGSDKNYTQKVVYHSSNLAAAFPPNMEGNRGRVEAVGIGSSTISVTDPVTGINSDPSGGSAVLTVVEAPTPTPTSTSATPTRTRTPTPTATSTPILLGLTISPLTPKRKVGETQNFTVQGQYSDGSTRSLTQAVTYSSSNTAVATTPNEVGNKSRVIAVGPGFATIKATHASGVTTTNTGGDATFEVIVAPTPTATRTGPTPTRTVTPLPTATSTPVVVSVALNPQSARRGLGGSQNFSAIATFSDGSTKNITSRCTYSSSNPGVAQTGSEPTNPSKVLAVGVGIATISAIDTVTNIGTTASGGDATLDVFLAPTPTPSSTAVTPTRTRTPTPTPTATPKLVSLVIAPTTVKKAVGAFQNFSVKGNYSDGSQKTFTQKVDYVASKPDIVEFYTDPANKGKVLAKKAGVVIITAKDPVTGIAIPLGEGAEFTVTIAPTPTPTYTGPTHTGPTGTPTLTASPTPSPTPKLVKIELKPKTAQKQVGTPQFFTATGTFSDGSTKNVTQRVKYASSDPSVASAPNADGNRGQILTLKAGTTTISAFDEATEVSSTTTGGDGVLTVVTGDGGGGGGTPRPGATATPLPVQPGNPTTVCQKHLRRAARTYVDKKMKVLDRCGSAASRCVQRKPNDPVCLEKTRARCTTALGKLANDEAKFIANVLRRCASLGPNDVFGSSGLGYNEVATSCEELFDRSLSDLSSVAQCLAAQHDCRAETLLSLVRPRTGEMLRLLGATSDAGSCREDFGGSGVGVGDPKGLGKAVERCVQTLVRGGASLTKTRLNSIGGCIDAVFVCVEADSGNAACLTAATERCAKDFGRVNQQIAKLTLAAGKACNGLDFALLGGPTGAYLDAITPDCESFGVPDVATVADYVACLVRRNECEVADLIRYESPRAGALLEEVDRTLVDGPCP